MRSKQRYLVIRIITEDGPPPEGKFRDAIWHQLQQLYGELGVSRVGFWVMSYHPELRFSIVRCQHNQVRELRAALATITSIGRTPLLLYVQGISGTMRKAKTLLPKHKN
ncbi:MAG: Rpp14/Pop5 family protein [Promethearchaeota archaeon]